MRLLSIPITLLLTFLGINSFGNTYAASSPPINKLATSPSFPNQFHQCTKVLNYKIYLYGKPKGHYKRHITREGNYININSLGHLNILFSKSTINMKSVIYWSTQRNHFTIDSFQRTIGGLFSHNVSAIFSDNGSKVTVTKNNKKNHYNESTKPILNIDAIVTQMRVELMKGHTNFDFILLLTDKTKHYYFAVKGEEWINSQMGRVKAIRVEQIKKKNRKLSLWFAPSLDYQLVRATYKRKFIDLKAELIKKNQKCQSESSVPLH